MRWGVLSALMVVVQHQERDWVPLGGGSAPRGGIGLLTLNHGCEFFIYFSTYLYSTVSHARGCPEDNIYVTFCHSLCIELCQWLLCNYGIVLRAMHVCDMQFLCL
jgi:hypothetical protein